MDNSSSHNNTQEEIKPFCELDDNDSCGDFYVSNAIASLENYYHIFFA
jgi:hypothetical protein